ncbi:MAG: CRTAC1 family protein [Acidobacteriota bacterium]
MKKPTRRRWWMILSLVALSGLPSEVWAQTGRTSRIRFEEIGEKAGVRQLHHAKSFTEISDVLRTFTPGGASAAIGDYNNDGREDLFVTNSDEGWPNRLFRNDGNLSFTEVTDTAGVAAGNEPGLLVTDSLWFDYDNNGWIDLLVVRFGTPLLYRNQGDGHFEDVTISSGLNKFTNAIAVIAFDYDRDGYLDLLIGNYFGDVNLYKLETSKVLPDDYDVATNGGGVTMWHNTGKGSFTDVTESAGFAHLDGWTLDVGHGDLNNNGLQDIYLAVDFGTDRVFYNNGDGTFRDATETAIGFDTRSGMNAELADYDNDGLLDVYVTNITGDGLREFNMLWHNNGDETFTDFAQETGTSDTLWGWGAKFADFNNDGWLDLYVVNGLRSGSVNNYRDVMSEMSDSPDQDRGDIYSWPRIEKMTWSGFQKTQLYQSLGLHLFREVAADAGVDNDLDGRGVLIADFDENGLLDVFQTNHDQHSLLYVNRSESSGNWVELQLIGTRSNRDAIGTRVTLQAGDLKLIREVVGGNGFTGQSSRRLHFGLGSVEKLEELEIRWPTGEVERVRVPLNQLSSIQEGSGRIQP